MLLVRASAPPDSPHNANQPAWLPRRQPPNTTCRCCFYFCSAARTGTVEVVTDEVYTDINGGVPPLADRITAAQELLAPRLALIEVEAECREQGDLKCQKVCGRALWDSAI
jgi:hypothetical protein